MSKVNLKKVREEEVEAKSPEGLRDGGHILLSCSNCNAILADVWRTRPHERDIWKVRCTCPFCGDKSFSVEIQGGFHLGGYGKVKADSVDDDFASTVMDNYDIQGDTFIFTMKKASENAKPIYKK